MKEYMSRKTEKKPDYYTQREWNRIRAREAAEKRKNFQLLLVVIVLALLTACTVYAVYFFVVRTHDKGLRVPYSDTSAVFGAPGSAGSMTADPFSKGLCVTDGDVNADSVFITATEGGLFDVNNQNVLYAKDIFEQRPQASLTKLMTALVALKYGNLDDVVTVTDTAFDIEEGSSVCELHLGDQLTLKQLLYGLLIASGNDAAQMIAEHVGGSVSQFVDMMNSEAQVLGATHSHFINPSGLTADGHYTCAYDVYLVFNALMKYDVFMDIISRKNYYAEYKDASGDAYAMTWDTTDHYLDGSAELPDNVTVYGGKTGTTDAAGACLCIMSKDAYGNPYVSVILNSQDKEQLYVDMNQILSLADNTDAA